ncbi:hypothetical protein PLICRDRAFT_178077 [Plicaturopsis crispa FD-325 SS-3]|nr:hypothetical protein PLICRDRAFT_178077 [Plicaturopsis crispa FD-325 SS-3]
MHAEADTSLKGITRHTGTERHSQRHARLWTLFARALLSSRVFCLCVLPSRGTGLIVRSLALHEGRIVSAGAFNLAAAMGLQALSAQHQGKMLTCNKSTAAQGAIANASAHQRCVKLLDARDNSKNTNGVAPFTGELDNSKNTVGVNDNNIVDGYDKTSFARGLATPKPRGIVPPHAHAGSRTPGDYIAQQ